MSSTMTPIYLDWIGPFKLDCGEVPDRDEFTNSATAWGVYQIYGSHPVYGPKVLLYIGKAWEQNFGTRLNQHGLADWTSDRGNLEIYLGRMLVSGDEKLSDSEWALQISAAEKLLIYAHSPALNSMNVHQLPTDVAQYHVLNYGCYAQLMEEVSGQRWDSACIEKVSSYKLYKYGK